MTFLRRVWATLATLPVIATALAASVTEVAGVIAHQLPVGPAGAVTHAGIAAVAVIGLGAFVVTQVETVEPELRGFPTAPLSKKAQALKDVADAAAATKAEYEARIAALEVQLAAIQPVAVEGSHEGPAAPVPAEPAAPTAEPVVPATP